MKRILSWAVVLAVLFVFSTILFITGKQHRVMLLNGEKGEKVPAKVTYIVDGQNADKPKSVRANKKAAVFVKGSGHEIIIKFKDENGQDKEIAKSFKAKLSKDATINLAGIINGTEDWITYKDKEND